MIGEATQPQLARRPLEFDVRLAESEDDILGAQRLRYAVFVEELGAGGDQVDHENRLERDELDPVFDHLLLVDRNRDPASHAHVIGVYRLLTSDRARALGRFYGDSEYDLDPLRRSGRKLVELGRSCVHRDYRRGAAMLHLWNALADYVLSREIEIMFGVASFPGTDPARHAMALSYLHHFHLAPPELRVRCLPQHFQAMDLIPPAEIDRAAALSAIPSLIRGYLRLGGFVGEGAFIDRDFNTTDVCLIMDTSAMSEKHFDFYARKAPRA